MPKDDADTLATLKGRRGGLLRKHRALMEAYEKTKITEALEGASEALEAAGSLNACIEELEKAVGGDVPDAS